MELLRLPEHRSRPSRNRGVAVVRGARPGFGVNGYLGYAQIVNCLLQFADSVLGTEHAAVGDGYVAQTDIVRLASLLAVADEALTGMVGENRFQGSTTGFI